MTSTSLSLKEIYGAVYDSMIPNGCNEEMQRAGEIANRLGHLDYRPISDSRICQSVTERKGKW